MPAPTSPHSATSDVPPTNSLQIDALLDGSKWGGAAGTGETLTFSFPFASGAATFSGPTGQDNYSELNEHLVVYHGYGLDSTEQDATRSALQTWANVCNLQFQEVADTSSNVGDMRFAWTSADEAQQMWGWAYGPSSYLPSGGDIWLSTANTEQNWTTGSHNFMGLIHEIGHALGLKHPFASYPVLPAAQDSAQYTVMSYTKPPQSLFREISTNADGSYTWRSFDVEPDTPMLYDIAASQYLYGANLSDRTDDVYSFDPSTPFFRTIWDAGGTDTITVSTFTKDCIIDLQQGHFSKITIESAPLPPGVTWQVPPPTPTYDGTDNLAIAYDAVIENAIGGNGNDTLTGNDSANTLTGGTGNDTLTGGNGIDVAAYAGNQAAHTVSKTSSGFTVSSGTEGSDSLTGIERVRFSDISLALDLDGNAGSAAKILGAVFGSASISNSDYVGIGLSLLDGGMSYEELAALAINAVGASTPQQVVNLLWTNVVGSAPTAGEAQPFVDMLNGGMSIGELGVFAADTILNQQNITLTGLTQTGIEYVE